MIRYSRTGSGSAGAPDPMYMEMPDASSDVPECLRRMGTDKDASPVLFRDGVIKSLEAGLTAKKKPNVLLTGPAGCGKTAVCEELARRIARHDPSVPEALADAKLYEFLPTALVSGSGIVGMLEEKMQELVSFAENPEIILFIDEIHLLSGRSPSYQQIAQILKPPMARGKIRIIGATTTQEARSLADDPAFSRRFSRITVPELTRAQTEVIAAAFAKTLSKHHGQPVLITEQNIKDICRTADEYHAPGVHRPDSALTLLDKTVCDALIERAELLASSDENAAAVIRALPCGITPERMRKSAKEMLTGQEDSLVFDADALKTELSRIKGQDAALDACTAALKRDATGLFPRTRPLSFLFAGPSGCGKTECAKILAQYYYGVKPIIINMAEYHSSASINRLIGSPAGYAGCDSNMELPLDPLQSNPRQLILLDEFEKADNSVQMLFLGALDQGYIDMADGRQIDLKHAVIIASTNAGFSVKRTSPIGFTAKSEHKVSDALPFAPELLSRFSSSGGILCFKALTKAVYADILKDAYRRIYERLKSRRLGLPDAIDGDALAAMLDGWDPALGARPAEQAAENYALEKAGL